MFSHIIEEESGTYCSKPVHAHQGYSAGTFAADAEPRVLDQWFAWGRASATAAR